MNELIDGPKCASEGIVNAMTSIPVKISFLIIATVIFLSFYFARLAILALLRNNIFSNSTQRILLVCLVNSVFHQAATLEIRVRFL